MKGSLRDRRDSVASTRSSLREPANDVQGLAGITGGVVATERDFAEPRSTEIEELVLSLDELASRK
jgi:hypothetical protein